MLTVQKASLHPRHTPDDQDPCFLVHPKLPRLHMSSNVEIISSKGLESNDDWFLGRTDIGNIHTGGVKLLYWWLLCSAMHNQMEHHEPRPAHARHSHSASRISWCINLEDIRPTPAANSHFATHLSTFRELTSSLITRPCLFSRSRIYWTAGLGPRGDLLAVSDENQCCY